MKGLIYLFYFIIFNIITVHAQLVSPTNPYFSYSGNDYFIVESTFTNNTQSETQFFWKRTIKQLPLGWETSICDPNYCRVVEVDTGSFEIALRAKGKLDCNFYLGPNAQSGMAIVELELYPKKTPEKKILITYTAEGLVTATGLDLDFNVNQKYSFSILEKSLIVNAVNSTSTSISLACIDALGNVIYRAEYVEKDPIIVPTISLAKGLYLIKIWSNSADYWCKKIAID